MLNSYEPIWTVYAFSKRRAVPGSLQV